MFETVSGCRSISQKRSNTGPEDVAILQALELVGEEKLVEKDVADVARKLGDVVNEVGLELAGVLALQGLECKA